MDFYRAVATRRTVRDFEDKMIPDDVLERIIGAGVQAPSNDHMREWEFIVLQDKAKRAEAIKKVPHLGLKKATAIIDDWGLLNESQREMYLDGIPKQYRMLLTAGCLMVLVFKHHGILLKPDSLSSLNAFASIWCCIENMLLAAASEGIFGAMRIPFDKEIKHLKTTLGIPEGYEIPCYLALGYPAKDVPPVRQLPITTKERIHIDHW